MIFIGKYHEMQIDYFLRLVARNYFKIIRNSNFWKRIRIPSSIFEKWIVNFLRLEIFSDILYFSHYMKFIVAW